MDTAKMDLAELERKMLVESWVEITHPVTNVPLGIRIKVACPDTEEFRKIKNRIKNRSMSTMQRTKGKVTAEALDEDALQYLVGVTRDWEGVVYEGSVMEYTEANVRTVYTKFPFIKHQVDDYIGDRSNFFDN